MNFYYFTQNSIFIICRQGIASFNSWCDYLFCRLRFISDCDEYENHFTLYSNLFIYYFLSSYNWTLYAIRENREPVCMILEMWGLTLQKWLNVDQCSTLPVTDIMKSNVFASPPTFSSRSVSVSVDKSSPHFVTGMVYVCCFPFLFLKRPRFCVFIIMIIIITIMY
jgi:hypothetical protein